MGQAREKFQLAVTDTLRDWRFGCLGQRVDRWREQAVFIEGFADVARLRLTAAYLPLFYIIDRIEDDVARIARLAANHDPYVPVKERRGLIETR